MTDRQLSEEFTRRREDESRKADWDLKPWFALATWSSTGRIDCVLITQSFEAYCQAWHQAEQDDLTREVWCGTFRDCDAFRARCYQRITKK